MKEGAPELGPIAITGSKGLLGSTLMQTLKHAEAIRADVRDAEALKREIVSLRPSAIVHTAAITDVGACERDPQSAYAVNTQGTANVVAAAQAIGVRVLHVSTASVFSGEAGNYKETDTPEPDNVYNKTKAVAETFVTSYDKGILVRLNIMGIHPEGSRGKNFMEWLVDSFEQNKDVSLFEDVRINALSSWTIADIFSSMLERNVAAGVYHIGTSDVWSKAEIGEAVAGEFPAYQGRLRHASVETIQDGVRRPKETWLNCDYTVHVLGITMPSMRDEIERIFRLYHT